MDQEEFHPYQAPETESPSDNNDSPKGTFAERINWVYGGLLCLGGFCLIQNVFFLEPDFFTFYGIFLLLPSSTFLLTAYGIRHNKLWPKWTSLGLAIFCTIWAILPFLAAMRTGTLSPSFFVPTCFFGFYAVYTLRNFFLKKTSDSG